MEKQDEKKDTVVRRKGNKKGEKVGELGRIGGKEGTVCVEGAE